MFLHEIINPSFVPLRATNTIADGLEAMNEQGVDTVALIDFTTGHLLGTAHRADLESEKDTEQTLFSKVRKKTYRLRSGMHVSDAVREMENEGHDFAAVMDDEQMYSGLVFRSHADKALVGLLNAEKEGALIMVEMAPGDYSLMDLIRITELESITILSLGIEPPNANRMRFRVSMKVNTFDIQKLLQALNRYGFTITSKSELADSDEDLHDRADEFMRFLNI